MIFPKREPVYQNLNTSFTNFGELLVDLNENSFTGVVQVSFWEYEGVMLLDNGNIINAVQEAITRLETWLPCWPASRKVKRSTRI
ncbi:MAG: hypothetical protein P8Y34_09965 [Anaerolineales bacterium]